MKEIHKRKQAYRTAQKHLFLADWANYLEEHTYTKTTWAQYSQKAVKVIYLNTIKLLDQMNTEEVHHSN